MKKRKTFSLTERKAKYGYLFILPLILGVAVIFIPSMFQTIRYSVSNIDSANGFALTFSGFSRYKEAFRSDPQFVPLLVSEIKTLLIDIPVIIIYSLFISTLINQKFTGRTIVRIIFFIPVIFAAGALSKMDSDALYYTGAGQIIDTGINSGASSFLEIQQMLSSLNFPKFLKDIVLGSVENIYGVASSSGLQIYIFLAGLQEIPISVYEAAEIEGCSKWELFWKITLPMIVPQISINAIYTIAASASTTNALLKHSNSLAFTENNYSLATAMNVIYLLTLGAVVLLVFILLKKFSATTDE